MQRRLDARPTREAGAVRILPPATLDEALALLAEHGGDAKPLAGGQSLIPAMNFRLATPAVLVDLNALGELALHHATIDGDVRIGAMTRQRAVERSARRRRSARRSSPRRCRTSRIRRFAIAGTIGGSLAHADPAAELPAVMLALNARLTRAAARPASRRFRPPIFSSGCSRPRSSRASC